MNPNIVIYVACEGKSEKAYITALNRLFRDTGIPCIINADSADSGRYKALAEARKRLSKRERKIAHLWIWADSDIYERGDDVLPPDVPKIYFSSFNFEDFLILHLPDDKVSRWTDICAQSGHLHTPLHSKDYEPHLRELFPEYKKGELPQKLTPLTEDHVRIALKHSLDPQIPFKCTFIEALAELIRLVRPNFPEQLT